MLMKVSDLDGRALNWAVAYVDEGDPTVFPTFHTFGKAPNTKSVLMAPNSRVGIDISEFDPSGNWAHGGPLIEGMRADIVPKHWLDIVPKHQGNGMVISLIDEDGRKVFSDAETTLKAFCQAYVHYKTGSDKIEIPDELCEVRNG